MPVVLHADLESKLAASGQHQSSQASTLSAAQEEIDSLQQQTQALQQQRQATHSELEQSLQQLEELRNDINKLEVADVQKYDRCSKLTEELRFQQELVESLNAQVEQQSEVATGILLHIHTVSDA